MKEYNTREYWPARLKKEGPLYVASRQSKDKQWLAFNNALIKAMEGTNPGTILDFGCGVGRFVETALTHATHYVGADINKEALEYAPNFVSASFVDLSEDRIPLENETFDSAMCVTVLQHIVDTDQFNTWSSEISRVVKPGGYFYIIDDASQRRKMGSHMKIRGPQIISEALGAEIDEDFGTISAEKNNSHYLFRSRKA